MAYSINYDRGKAEKKPIAHPVINYFAVGAILVLGLLCARSFRDEISVLLHPLTDPMAQVAWAEMTEQISVGSPVSAALEAFCRQILSSGQIS